MQQHVKPHWFHIAEAMVSLPDVDGLPEIILEGVESVPDRPANWGGGRIVKGRRLSGAGSSEMDGERSQQNEPE
jgi:hypothetical protein